MKKYIKILLVLIIGLTISITTVGAKSYIKDLFQAEENLEIENELDGTAFLAGTKVNIEKKINGIGFIAGETVTIKDNQEYIITASTKLNMEADIENDLFLFTETANISGNVKRDTYMFATEAKLDGEFGRNTYIAGTNVELNGTFEGNVTINAVNIEIDDDAVIKGTLKYNDTAEIVGLNDNIKTKTYTEETQNLTLKDYIESTLISYINVLVIGLLLIFMNKNILTKTLKQSKENSIFNISIKGFVVIIGIPIIVLMLLMSGILSSVGIVGGIIYGVLIYISSIFTGYHLGNYIDNKYIKKNMNPYKTLVIGLLILKVLILIPLLGTFVSLFSLLYGTGIISNMIIEAKK